MLGKFRTHEFRCTDKRYDGTQMKSGGQQLQEAILGFFEHYRTENAKEKYEFLKTKVFEEEFFELEKGWWMGKICCKIIMKAMP